MDASDNAARRRNIASPEKPLSPAQGGSEPGQPSDTSAPVPSTVLYTLLGFTFAMAVIPIGSYFVTLKLVFHNSTYAGAFAAVMANVVLIAYVVVAMREEDLGDTVIPVARERRKSGGGRGVVIDEKKGQ